MALTAEALAVVLAVQNLGGFKAGMGEASASVRGFAGASKEAAAAADLSAASNKRQAESVAFVNKAIKASFLGLAVAVFEGYKMGAKFDTQMAQIQMVTHQTQPEIQKLRNHLLDLAGPLGQSPEALAEAFSHISRIDLPHGIKNIDVLVAAAHGANVGLADVRDTADTLAGVIKTQMPGVSRNVTTAMGQLIAAAQTGNMTLTDFNHALGVGILPVAKNYGLTLTDITGALAVFTDEHMQGSSAMAQLATSLHFLTGATKKGETALESMGLTGAQLALDMRSPRGLHKALSDLKQHLEAAGGAGAEFNKDSKGNLTAANEAAVKQTQLLQEILPGGRGRILQVLMNQLDNYNVKINQQEKQTSRTHANVIIQSQTTAMKIKQAWSGLQADLIRFYDTYKGPVTIALVGLVGGVGDVIQILKAVSPVLIPLVALLIAFKAATIAATAAEAVAAFVTGGWATAFWTLDAAIGVLVGLPFLILIGIIALGVGIYELFNHWKWFHDAVINTWNWIKTHWKTIGEILLIPIWPVIWLIKLLIPIFVSIWNWIKTHWPQIKDVLVAPFKPLYSFVKTIWGMINDIYGFVKNPLKSIWHGATSIFDAINPFGGGGGGSDPSSSGGPPPTVGASLVSVPMPKSLGAGASSPSTPRSHTPDPKTGFHPVPIAPIHTHVMINGREVATAIHKFDADTKARK